MKTLILLFLLISSICAKSQNISDNNIYRLSKLGINTNNINLYDLDIQNDLNNILRLDKKRKTNKTVAVVLTCFSASGIISGGAILLSNKDNSYNGNSIRSTIAGFSIASGVIYGGVSIPFWISSSKRKKQRNKIKQAYQ